MHEAALPFLGKRRFVTDDLRLDYFFAGADPAGFADAVAELLAFVVAVAAGFTAAPAFGATAPVVFVVPTVAVSAGAAPVVAVAATLVGGEAFDAGSALAATVAFGSSSWNTN
jgi:hypothetical protein